MHIQDNMRPTAPQTTSQEVFLVLLLFDRNTRLGREAASFFGVL